MARPSKKIPIKTDFLRRLEMAKAAKVIQRADETDRDAFIRYCTDRAKALKIPNPVAVRQNVQNWLVDGKMPTAENYVYLAEIFNVSVQWLITGRGSMLRGHKLSPEDDEVIKIYHALKEANEHEGWLTHGRNTMRLVTKAGVLDPLGKKGKTNEIKH